MLLHEEPFRSCVACRNSRPKQELLRFVRAPDGTIAFDVRNRVESRGAYTCPNPSCVRRAVERGGFQRAFEAAVLARPDALVESVTATLEGEVLQGLGLARRASQLAAGRDEAARAFDAGRAKAVVVARDLSERSRADVSALVGSQFDVLVGPVKEQMGTAIGRKPTGVIALLTGSVVERVTADLRRATGFRLASPDAQASVPGVS